MLALLSQLPDMNLGGALLVYGPMGIFCAWFMLRVEKLIGEVRNVREALYDITKAMLMDVITRDVGTHSKDLAREMLAKLKEEEDRRKR